MLVPMSAMNPEISSACGCNSHDLILRPGDSGLWIQTIPLHSQDLMLIKFLSHRISMAGGALALMVSATPAHAAPPTGSGWNRVWSDEFEGDSLDLTKWQHRLTGLRRQAFNTPGAVKVAGGNLTISTFTTGSTHYTGMVASHETFLYTYGYIEARINFDTSPGMWSAFWMQSPTMGTKSIYDLDPALAGTEIDICEHRAVNQNGSNISSLVVGNIHARGYGADQRSTGYTPPNLDLGGGYHLYGMEWTPTQQKFYINGALRWTFDTGGLPPVSNRSEYIWLSSEVESSASVDWAGPVPVGGYGSLDTTTTKMVVDYVRVYQRAETVANSDFGGRLAPFEATNGATWSGTGGRTSATAGKLAPATVAGASLRQTLNGLMPDTGYTLTAWGNAGSSNPSLFMGVEDHGFPATGEALTADAYALASVPFTTGPSNRSATVVARSNEAGSIAHVDDFLLRRHASVTNGRLETGDRLGWNNPYGGTALIEFLRRGTAGTGASLTSTAPGSVPTPPWRRVTRLGGFFTPYWSLDGVSWTRMDQLRNPSINVDLLAGLALATGDQTRLGEAAFDNVALTEGVPDVQITEPADRIAHAANGGSLRLVATLTGGSAATIQWSKLSGPGTVTFSDETSATTYAAFSAPGI